VQRFALLAVVVAGCVEPSLKPCGDLYCSIDDICVPNPDAVGDEPSTVCARQDQLDACAGLADGDNCSGGYCSLGVCTPNSCGDNRVTGTESCEGEDVRVTCANLGYYRGETSCTPTCSIDASQCSGTCGDNIIDAAEGEICDGAPPDETCVDNGRDWGDLTCSRFCLPALTADCRRYGMTSLLPPVDGEPIVSANANAHGVAALTASRIRLRWDGVDSEHPRTPDAKLVLASSSILAVFGSTSVSWFDGTWHDITHTLPTSQNTANNASLSDDGFIYAIDDGCSNFVRLSLATGAVESLAGLPDAECYQVAAFDANNVYVSAGGIYYFDGTTWTQVDLDFHPFFQKSRAGHVIVGPTLEDFAVDHGTLVSRTHLGGTATKTTLATDDDGTEVSTYDNDGVAQRFLVSGPYGADVPFLGAARSPSGQLIVWTSEVLRIDPQELRNPTSAAIVTSIAILPDERLAFWGSTIAGAIDPDLGSLTVPFSSSTQGSIVDFAGDPRHVHYIASVGSGAPLRGLWRYDEATHAYAHETTTALNQIALTPAGVLYARLSGALYIRDASAGALLSLPPPAGCAIASEIAASAAGLYTLLACTGGTRVYRNDGTWTALSDPTPGLSKLQVAPDGTVFVVHAGTIQRLEADGLHDVLVAPPSLDFHALSHDELFVRRDTGSLLHYINGGTNVVSAPEGPFAVTRNNIIVRTPSNQVDVIPRVPSLTQGKL
jgi:hypothetical protein